MRSIKTIGWLAALLSIFLITPYTVQSQQPGAMSPGAMQDGPETYSILGVTVVGTDDRTANFVKATADLTEGGQVTIPGQQISDAIKSLYETGLFSDIKIVKSEVVGDGVYLEIQVTEQPRLDSYEFEGVSRSDRRDLRDKLPLTTGFAVTEASKNQARRTIERFYADKGHRDVSVDISEELVDEERNRVKLVFNVETGQRIQIGRIEFEGNDNFSDRQLKRSLGDLKQDTWWRLTRQLFTEEEFQEAKENLIAYYGENGYLDARVLDDSVYVYERRRGRNAVGIKMEVEEGNQYTVRNIDWEGNTVYTDEQLTQALGLESGDVMNMTQLQRNLYQNQDETDVFSMYHNVGYLNLDLRDNIRVVGENQVDLEFDIVEDEIFTIRRVDFYGNTKTHDDVVRRSLRNVPGRDYSRSAIMRSVRELSQLGYFVPENIEPDLDPDLEDKTVDIRYDLDESQSTDNFELSGGYGGSGLGVILSARINFNNFSVQNMMDTSTWNPLPSGDGQRVSIGAQVTGRGYQSYNFSFQEPWFRGRPNSLGFSTSYSLFRGGGGVFGQPGGFRQQAAQRQGRQEQLSASVNYGRRLTWPDDHFQRTSRLQYQYFDVEGFQEIFGGQDNILSYKETIQRNSLNNPIAPTSGSRIELSGEVAPPLPGFSQFYKTEFKFQQHNTIIERLVSSFGMEYGYMGWFSDENRSQFQRYYLGGTEMQHRQTFTRDNVELRGYPGGFEGTISPVVDGQQVGGTVYNKMFAELSYPAVNSEQIRLIPYLFAEGGNAFDGFGNFQPFDMKRSAGIGARVFMPILGLIDISYGYRFDGIPGTNVQAGQWEFLFNIGSPF